LFFAERKDACENAEKNREETRGFAKKDVDIYTGIVI